jgi:hypothetical protein
MVPKFNFTIKMFFTQDILVEFCLCLLPDYIIHGYKEQGIPNKINLELYE